ncbi:hypothetical protein Tco_0450746 [Tanacetum coccineum]
MEYSKCGNIPMQEKPNLSKAQEAEYIAIAEASMEAVWIRKYIDGLRSIVPTNKKPMELLRDNTCAIAIANDLEIIKGARHYQKKYHYIREVIENGNIILNKVHTDGNVADPFTKTMPLTQQLNMRWELDFVVLVVLYKSVMYL